MKRLAVFALLLAVVAIQAAEMVEVGSAPMCYCSVKCGPRVFGSVKGDYQKGPIKDMATGICFCQPRDYDLWYNQGKCRGDIDRAQNFENSVCGA